jgi:hypothetical protein
MRPWLPTLWLEIIETATTCSALGIIFRPLPLHAALFPHQMVPVLDVPARHAFAGLDRLFDVLMSGGHTFRVCFVTLPATL